VGTFSHVAKILYFFKKRKRKKRTEYLFFIFFSQYRIYTIFPTYIQPRPAITQSPDSNPSNQKYKNPKWEKPNHIRFKKPKQQKPSRRKSNQNIKKKTNSPAIKPKQQKSSCPLVHSPKIIKPKQQKPKIGFKTRPVLRSLHHRNIKG
jgi:hypothetical protein